MVDEPEGWGRVVDEAEGCVASAGFGFGVVPANMSPNWVKMSSIVMPPSVVVLGCGFASDGSEACF